MVLRLLSKRLIGFFLLSLLLPNVTAAAEPGMMVMDAWVRSLPAVSRVNSGYLTLRNRSAVDDRLVKVTTPMAAVAEIHLSEQTDGIVSMRQVDGLDIAAGERVTLISGGYHLMFKQISNMPLKGETVALTLHFVHAGEVQVKAHVGAAAAMQNASKESHQHH